MALLRVSVETPNVCDMLSLLAVTHCSCVTPWMVNKLSTDHHPPPTPPPFPSRIFLIMMSICLAHSPIPVMIAVYCIP